MPDCESVSVLVQHLPYPHGPSSVSLSNLTPCRVWQSCGSSSRCSAPASWCAAPMLASSSLIVLGPETSTHILRSSDATGSVADAWSVRANSDSSDATGSVSGAWSAQLGGHSPRMRGRQEDPVYCFARLSFVHPCADARRTTGITLQACPTFIRCHWRG